MVALMGSVRPIDNLDDRKQIRIALERMTSGGRIAFLNWALTLAPINLASGGKNPLRATSEGDKGVVPFPWGSVEQVYFDLMTAIQQYNVPIDLVLRGLEFQAKRMPVGLQLPANY